MTYGPEVPFSGGFCTDDETCTLLKGTTITVTNTWTINGDISQKNLPVPGLGSIEAAFKLGTSYSESNSLAYQVTAAHQHSTEKGKCGYWTFLPYLMESVIAIPEWAH